MLVIIHINQSTNLPLLADRKSPQGSPGAVEAGAGAQETGNLPEVYQEIQEETQGSHHGEERRGRW